MSFATPQTVIVTVYEAVRDPLKRVKGQLGADFLQKIHPARVCYPNYELFQPCAFAPATISVISWVIAAWRARL